jgi:hypothetical protein
MKTAFDPRLESARLRSGVYATTARDGPMGAFIIMGPKGAELAIISSGIDMQYGWEHVSVSCKHRMPNWTEMCFVKDLFWNDDEVVVQYHPAKADYVNFHPNCLHLWRPTSGVLLPVPPSHLVGPKT